MILIFGGAYQGKLAYALETFHYQETDAYRWPAPEGAGEAEASGAVEGAGATSAPGAAVPRLLVALPEQSVLCGLENLIWDCCCAGVEAKDWLAARRAQWQNKILIAADVSQGLVPMDARERAYREMNGRTLLYLAKEAEQVHRVFCGLGQRLK